jgi:hypothetical protein
LNTLGHNILRFELEGELVDSIATVSFASVSGICNTGGVVTVPRTFTGNTEWKYKYRVKGFDFATIYEGFVKVEAGNCGEVQLF